jgi:DNA-binding CsgD family transcriptional regulator
MAIKKGIKKKEGENLTDAHIEKVISLLGAEKPITKKEACEILNISYNTTRLTKIINEYLEEQESQKKRRAANKGKPLNDYEKQVIIEGVLDGDSVTEIAKRLYRSTASVNKTIEEIGIPERSDSYVSIAILPDLCVSDSFNAGELVWCARSNKIAVVREDKCQRNPDILQVYEFERLEEDSPFFPNCRTGDYGGQYASYPKYEVGRLEHLKQYGIDLYRTYTKHFPLAIRQAIGMETK